MANETTSTPQPNTPARGTAPKTRGTAARPAPAEPVRRPSGPSIAAFVKESRAELRKVTWPTNQETSNLTLAVVGMTIGIALFLGLIDEILNYVITPLIGGK